MRSSVCTSEDFDCKVWTALAWKQKHHFSCRIWVGKKKFNTKNKPKNNNNKSKKWKYLKKVITVLVLESGGVRAAAPLCNKHTASEFVAAGCVCVCVCFQVLMCSHVKVLWWQCFALLQASCYRVNLRVTMPAPNHPFHIYMYIYLYTYIYLYRLYIVTYFIYFSVYDRDVQLKKTYVQKQCVLFTNSGPMYV